MKALRELKNTFKDLGLANAKLNPVVHSTQKHETTLLPPKMVIRATADYVPESPHELSFHKGDFFMCTPAPIRANSLGLRHATQPLMLEDMCL